MRTAVPAAGERYRRSGEGEEQFLQLLLAHRRHPATGQALPHPAGHDLETRPVQCPGHRRQLGDHLGTVPPVLDHRDDPGKLAMGAAEPVEHLARGVFVDLHQSALPVGLTIPTGVSRNAAGYSHSMVPGGLLVTSSTTRLISGTSLVIRVAIVVSTGSGTLAQSAVMASSLVTGRSTTGCP